MKPDTPSTPQDDSVKHHTLKSDGSRIKGPTLAQLSAAATPGPWRSAPKRLVVNGQQGPIMSYLYGDANTPEGMRVSLGSERIADHDFVAALVNAFRAGELVEKT